MGRPYENESKPNMVQVVFDAAIEFGGTSLQKVLLTGPDLLNNLIGLLDFFYNSDIELPSVESSTA